MTDFVIDIHTKIISPDARIWRMFPGDEYKFLPEFRKHSAVFLDLPGFSLPEGQITDSTPTLRERIIQSWKVQGWIEDYKRWVRSGESGPEPARPSSNFYSYLSEPKNRNYGRHLGAIKALFSEAQKGDLVVVPNKISSRQVFIGEFLDSPKPSDHFAIGGVFLDETTAYRRVQWFPPVNELRIPSEISDALRIPISISLLGSQYYRAIFELSYGSYVRGEEVFCRFYVDTEDFNSQNTFDLGSLAKLAALLSADLPDSEIEAELPNYLNFMLTPQFEPSLTMNINSRGVGGFRGSTLAPLIIGILLSYMPQAAGKSDIEQNTISITNSVENPDACVLDADKPLTSAIEERVAQRLALIGLLEHHRACQRAKRLRDDAKLRTDSTTRQEK